METNKKKHRVILLTLAGLTLTFLAYGFSRSCPSRKGVRETVYSRCMEVAELNGGGGDADCEACYYIAHGIKREVNLGE